MILNNELYPQVLGTQLSEFELMSQINSQVGILSIWIARDGQRHLSQPVSVKVHFPLCHPSPAAAACEG